MKKTVTTKSRAKVASVRPRPSSTEAKPRAASQRKPTLKPVEGLKGTSLVSQTVDALRKVVLSAAGPDVFLGSEEHLIEALGVSRPTFRQAAKLLRHENLLVIKRGMGGGFFTQAPSGEAVSRMAAIYLNAQGTTMLQIHDALSPIMAEAAALVARNPDPAVRIKPYEYVQQTQLSNQDPSSRALVRDLLHFDRVLGDLSGNPALALMMSVLRDLLRDARHAGFEITAQRTELLASFQMRLAEAVRDGDAEMVKIIVSRYTREIREGLLPTS